MDELHFWLNGHFWLNEIMHSQVLREAAPCSGTFGELPVARIVVAWQGGAMGLN